MILGFVRLALAGFVVMTVFYILISIYSRSLRREKLEKRWVAEGAIGDRDAYVRKGLEEYDASIRPKLILLVYVVPTVTVAVIMYLTSFS